MKFLANQKLAMRISIITTVITFAGMLLLWFIVSSRVSSMVKNLPFRNCVPTENEPINIHF